MSNRMDSKSAKRSGIVYAMQMTRHGGFMHDRREVRGGAFNEFRMYLDEAMKEEEETEQEEVIE